MAYAYRSLSPSEKNYGITELETLAVVWAISHLYGHKVTVHTDHAAVKAVLDAPNFDGKHTRWRNKVHDSEIREVDIVYQEKHHNCHADALSRQLVLSRCKAKTIIPIVWNGLSFSNRGHPSAT